MLVIHEHQHQTLKQVAFIAFIEERQDGGVDTESASVYLFDLVDL